MCVMRKWVKVGGRWVRGMQCHDLSWSGRREGVEGGWGSECNMRTHTISCSTQSWLGGGGGGGGSCH